jgi:isopentenyldiphosphate isomerase
MDQEEIFKVIKKFDKELPKFSDGRIDYSKSNAAPVMTVFVKYKTKILLLKRSEKVGTYQSKWNTVAGYLDELKPIKKKILEELKEELGIKQNKIRSIHFGKAYNSVDRKINKTWLIHPVLVELKEKPKIKLNWEHTEYQWLKPKETEKFDTVPKFDKSLKNAFL